jgi:hypothetical protein
MSIFHHAILIFTVAVLGYLTQAGEIADHSNALATGVAIGLEPMAYESP